VAQPQVLGDLAGGERLPFHDVVPRLRRLQAHPPGRAVRLECEHHPESGRRNADCEEAADRAPQSLPDRAIPDDRPLRVEPLRTEIRLAHDVGDGRDLLPPRRSLPSCVRRAVDEKERSRAPGSERL
jgi:hypothetical protein